MTDKPIKKVWSTPLKKRRYKVGESPRAKKAAERAKGQNKKGKS